MQRPAARRSLRQTAHLLRLLECLREAGVKAMAYKGPVSAQRLYGDVTMRNWADLDLVVSREQLPAARNVLLENGFVDSSPFNAKWIRRKRGDWGELEFCSPEHGLRVEAHWEVREAIGARAIPGDGLLARAVPAATSVGERFLRRHRWTPCSSTACMAASTGGTAWRSYWAWLSR